MAMLIDLAGRYAAPMLCRRRRAGRLCRRWRLCAGKADADNSLMIFDSARRGIREDTTSSNAIRVYLPLFRA